MSEGTASERILKKQNNMINIGSTKDLCCSHWWCPGNDGNLDSSRGSLPTRISFLLHGERDPEALWWRSCTAIYEGSVQNSWAGANVCEGAEISAETYGCEHTTKTCQESLCSSVLGSRHSPGSKSIACSDISPVTPVLMRVKLLQSHRGTGCGGGLACGAHAGSWWRGLCSLEPHFRCGVPLYRLSVYGCKGW